MLFIYICKYVRILLDVRSHIFCPFDGSADILLRYLFGRLVKIGHP